MYFKIIDGKPYYYKDGTVYEVEIDGSSIKIGRSAKRKTGSAIYTLPEIKAKCVVLSSITESKKAE